jgi:hypothetical protein
MYWLGHELKEDNFVEVNSGGITVKYAIGNHQVDAILKEGTSIEKVWNVLPALRVEHGSFDRYLDTLELETITLNLLKDIYATKPRM